MNPPDVARDHDERGAAAASSVLVELGQVLGAYRRKFVIVGGAVPWLLMPEVRPSHVGTPDILTRPAPELGTRRGVRRIEFSNNCSSGPFGATLVSPSAECTDMSTTSLKLPEELKQLAATAARQQGVTLHAFMVDAIRAAATNAERRAQFVADAVGARKDAMESGKGYEAAEVHAYLQTRAQGRSARKPRAKAWRA